MRDSLNNDPSLVQRFMKSLRACDADGRMDRRHELTKDRNPGRKAKPQNAVSYASKLRGRPTRGYDLLIETNYHSGLGDVGETGFQKRKHLDIKWRNLTQAERDAYNVAAREDTDQAFAHGVGNFCNFLARHGDADQSRRAKKRNRYKSDRLRAIRTTTQEMLAHPVFDAGSRLHDFSTGLRPTLVRK